MAYTKYSLTPANNNAAPPDGAPEGMLPSAVNDTMRDMMAQIRDVGDGIRGGTYTMTAPVITGGSITGVALSGNTFTNPVITGGSINNTPIGASTANTGAFTTLSATGATTLSGTTVVSGSLTANTFSSSGATITGGSINSTAIGGSTAAAGAFTTLSASGVATFSAGTVSAPAISTTGDTNTGIFFPAADTIAFTEGGVEVMRVDSSGRVGIGTSSPVGRLAVNGISNLGTGFASTDITNTRPAYVRSSDNNSLISFQSSSTTGDGFMVGMAGAEPRLQVTNNLPLIILTNNTERMRIDSSGNVGIGTTTLSNGRLSVLGAGGATANTAFFSNIDGTYNAYLQIQNNGINGVKLFQGSSFGGSASTLTLDTQGAMVFQTASGTERMRIDSSGNVGIGTSSPAGRLHANGAGSSDNAATNPTVFVQAPSNLLNAIKFNGAASTDLYIGRPASVDAIAFGTVSVGERMRITSAGEVCIGATATSGSARFYLEQNLSSNQICRIVASNTSTPFGVLINYSGAAPNGTGNEFFICSDTGATRATIRSNGGIANYSANDVNLASDERLKKDISPLSTTWNKIKQIEIVNFRYKDCNENDPLLYGVIAQQVQQIVPELVVVTQEAKEATDDAEATPEYFGIREQPMYWLAIKSLQEAMERIEKLEAEVALLKSK